MKARNVTSFTRSTYPGAVVLQAQGALDVVSVPVFRSALREAVDEGRPLVVVDLQQVSFLDSAGLAVVFGAQRQMPVSQRMMLANVPDRMSRMLRLAGVDAVVDVHVPGEPQPWLDES